MKTKKNMGTKKRRKTCEWDETKDDVESENDTISDDTESENLIMMRMMSMIMAMSLMRMMIARVMSMKVQVNRARQLLARMELGLPPLLPPTPRTTRLLTVLLTALVAVRMRGRIMRVEARVRLCLLLHLTTQDQTWLLQPCLIHPVMIRRSVSRVVTRVMMKRECMRLMR